MCRDCDDEDRRIEEEKKMGEMRVMGLRGDVTLKWNPQNTWEADDAKKEFYRLKKDGYLAFKVSKEGAKGELLEDFDPYAEKVIMSPPVRGG